MNPRIRHEVGLELGEVHVEGAVEAERGGDGGHDLADEAVEVGVGGALDVQVAAADVVDGLVVHHEGTVGVLEGGVGGEDGVVGLHHRGGHLGRRVDGELQLGLLPVVHGESLHQERGEAGASAATEGVEDEESLETSTLISQLPDPVQDQVHDLLPDGVVAPGVVVGGVLLPGDELLGVEELPVDPGPHLVDDGGLQVDEDSPGDVLARTGLNREVKVSQLKTSTVSLVYLGEEGVEAVISAPNSLVRWHAAIRLDPVL